jgi:hypothetical protein
LSTGLLIANGVVVQPAHGENFGPETVAMSDCVIGEIATGRHFFINATTGDLFVKKGALQVIVVCQRQSEVWIRWCEFNLRHDGACTEQALQGAEELLVDAYGHRRNLPAWRKDASR